MAKGASCQTAADISGNGFRLRLGGEARWFIEIKTDNDPLYAFTLEELEAVGYEIVEQTADLHHSDYAARLVMTEYEKKFPQLWQEYQLCEGTGAIVPGFPAARGNENSEKIVKK